MLAFYGPHRNVYFMRHEVVEHMFNIYETPIWIIIIVGNRVVRSGNDGLVLR